MPSIAVTGSIATDHLMHFPGKFSENFVAGQLDRVSLSFLVDDLVVRRGGVAANIAFTLGVLGRHPILAGAVGEDFADYRSWLERHGVDCSGVLTVPGAHTPRFTCTTDDEQCQIASFYPGAMDASAGIDLVALLGSQDVALVLIGASMPAAMLAHTAQARSAGVAFAADPSQQLPRLTPEECLRLVDGAAYLFTNEYEWQLLTRKTEQDLTGRVGLRVTTLGAGGSLLTSPDLGEVRVPAVPPRTIVDPTGVGDAFRGGFLAAIDNGLDIESAARFASLIATAVLESTGAQEWTLDPDDGLARLANTYGPAAAGRIEPMLFATEVAR